SVQRSRVDDVCYKSLLEPATSPIIMSHRVNDRSPELALMAGMIMHMYRQWDYGIPESLHRFEGHEMDA
ncbi:MAG TPA: hypothetical protein VGC10_03835, partial [Sphingomonas sp.]